MLMSMRGAWIGEDGVQQGFPSQEGGPRLIRFECPRWRPKAIQVRAQFGVQEQCAINGRPGRIRIRFWTFYIWLEAQFHRSSNGTGLMPKFVLRQRESSKQIDVQNLPRCCVASLMGLRPKLGAPHPWSPKFSYLLSSHRLRNLSLIYLLALATTEQPPSCRCRVIQTPPSSDIKIARLRFLFVLRLHTRIDLRDHADLAPARLVTIRSWFSDCIGASGLLIVVGS
jgi:hypothetical protein